MLFNSLEFFIFFPITTLLYFLIPATCRWPLLLLASCIFYMAFIPIYLSVLFFMIVVDYIAGVFIESSQGTRRRIYLIVSIFSNVGILAIFKYYTFLNNNLALLGHFLQFEYSGPTLSLILPLGLSFHTFQAMSYTIEVYRGHQKAERNFGIYALYVMFYPQLVAGPIERPQNLIHQFRERHLFDYGRVTDGLRLMAWGLFKKIVIADRLAVFVNHVYAEPTGYQGIPLIIATVFFAFQIYTDFSAYSDIAIGAAKVMGFTLMQNFKSPYLSESIAEFWRRWHISLSTWFRDYVYIPLGGNRGVKRKWYFNIFVTFLLSGLWHGANWTYVVWGAMNGFFVLSSLWSMNVRSRLSHFMGFEDFPKVSRCLNILTTFCLVCFSWIFFRANSLSDALYVSTHLFSGTGRVLSTDFLLGQRVEDLVMAILAICVLCASDYILRYSDTVDMLLNKPVWFRWTAYYALLGSILLFGKFGDEAHQFIYFQF